MDNIVGPREVELKAMKDTIWSDWRKAGGVHVDLIKSWFLQMTKTM